MPLYVFYPTRSDDISLTFEAAELDDDQQAADFASAVLRRHPSCDLVIAWRGSQKVLVLDRDAVMADSGDGSGTPSGSPSSAF